MFNEDNKNNLQPMDLKEIHRISLEHRRALFDSFKGCNIFSTPYLKGSQWCVMMSEDLYSEFQKYYLESKKG